MAVGRFGQSLDIGKEIEAEKNEEALPVPCGCDAPKPKRADYSEQAEPKPEPQEKIDEASTSEASAKTAEPAEDEKRAEEEKHTEKNHAEEEQFNKSPSEEQEEEQIPAREPDPAEDDVNEIMTKDFPVLKQRKRVLDKILPHSWLFWIIFIIVVCGLFFVWKIFSPDKTSETLPAGADYSFINSTINGTNALLTESAPLTNISMQNLSKAQSKPASPSPLVGLNKTDSKNQSNQTALLMKNASSAVNNTVKNASSNQNALLKMNASRINTSTAVQNASTNQSASLIKNASTAVKTVQKNTSTANAIELAELLASGLKD